MLLRVRVGWLLLLVHCRRGRGPITDVSRLSRFALLFVHLDAVAAAGVVTQRGGRQNQRDEQLVAVSLPPLVRTVQQREDGDGQQDGQERPDPKQTGRAGRCDPELQSQER